MSEIVILIILLSTMFIVAFSKSSVQKKSGHKLQTPFITISSIILGIIMNIFFLLFLPKNYLDAYIIMGLMTMMFGFVLPIFFMLGIFIQIRAMATNYKWKDGELTGIHWVGLFIFYMLFVMLIGS